MRYLEQQPHVVPSFVYVIVCVRSRHHGGRFVSTLILASISLCSSSWFVVSVIYCPALISAARGCVASPCHVYILLDIHTPYLLSMQSQMTAADIAATKKKRTFRKFTFRGVDLDQLLDMNYEQLMTLVHARARRRFSRGEEDCVTAF